MYLDNSEAARRFTELTTTLKSRRTVEKHEWYPIIGAYQKEITFFQSFYDILPLEDSELLLTIQIATVQAHLRYPQSLERIEGITFGKYLEQTVRMAVGEFSNCSFDLKDFFNIRKMQRTKLTREKPLGARDLRVTDWDFAKLCALRDMLFNPPESPLVAACTAGPLPLRLMPISPEEAARKETFGRLGFQPFTGHLERLSSS